MSKKAAEKILYYQIVPGVHKLKCIAFLFEFRRRGATMIWHSVNLIKSKDNKDYFYKIIKLNMQTFNSYRRIAL